MDAVKFMDERARMCNAYNQCRGCPITDWCGQGIRAQAKYSTDIISAVEKWAAAHPAKTRQSEFLKQWPNAAVNEEGVLFCPKTVNTAHFCCCKDKGCGDCRREFWLEEV